MTKKLTGTEPYQTPLNADLGNLAYIDKDNMPDISVRWINVKDPNNRQSSLELYTSDYYRDSNDAAIAYNWRFTNEGNVNRLRLLGTNPNMAVPTIFPLYVEGTTQDVVLSGNLRVASGKGIDFSATANGIGTTTSEVLDVYEEGTWTPIPRGTATGTSTDAAFTSPAGHQSGTYTRVGTTVHISMMLFGTNFNGTGDFEIHGLPFTVAGSAGTMAVQANNPPWITLSADNQNITAYPSLYKMAFRATSRNGGGNMSVAQCGGSTTVGYIRISGSYHTTA